MAAAQQQPLKILAIGAPRSALTTLVAKVAAINGKHGPFDACVVAGDLFAEGSDGSEVVGVEMPVPTYFTIGRNALPASVQERIAGGNPEVAPNLVYLGKSSVFTTAQGLKVAVVGGIYDAAAYDDESSASPYSPYMSKSGIASLLSHPALAGPQADSFASAKDRLPAAFHGVDVLLTTSPPPSLSLLSPSFPSLGYPLAHPAPPLAEVVTKARPRYLFWADGDGFWEREPFGWASPGSAKEERWTRAVKLGALGDVGAAAASPAAKPARWFYATSLPAQTATTPVPARPANATPNPFTMPASAAGAVPKRPAEDGAGGNGDAHKKGKKEHGPPPEHYICKLCNTPGHWIQDCPTKAQQDPSKPPAGYTCNLCQSPDHFIRDCPKRGEERSNRGGPRPPPPGYVCKACGKADEHYVRECPVVKERNEEQAKRKELGPAECWFCLSNPKVTKHLIVGIGSEAYVTLPKGQLIATHHGDAKPLVPGGGHVLIIPVAHHPTLLSIPPADAMDIISEIEAYKSSLRSCYAKYGAVPVSFEVGRLAGRGGHAHVQVIPIPAAQADKVADAFRNAGAAAGIDWEPEAERALARVGPTGNYFKVECPDGTKMVHLLKGNFDLQFGRLVVAGLLGTLDRVNWKDCVQSDAEDKDDAQKFKRALAPFLPK